MNSITLLGARGSQESRWMVCYLDISQLLRLGGSAQPPDATDRGVADVPYCIATYDRSLLHGHHCLSQRVFAQGGFQLLFLSSR